MPGNRLELDIVANDRTGPETQKASANLRSVEQEAGRVAQGMSRSFDQQGVALVRSVEKATAGAVKALQTLENRAAVAGKTGVERLLAQRSVAIGSYGGDEAAIQRVVQSYDKLISAQQRVDRSRAQIQTRQAGIAAGQAVLPGAAGFDSALAAIQKKDRAIADLERRARFSGTDAVGRLALEENEAIRQLGKTPADIDRVRSSYAKLKADATPAVRSISDSLDDMGQRATRVGGTLAILSIPLALGAKRAITLASNLEAARVGFIATSGSAAAADKHIQALRTFGEKTPFEFTTLIDQSRFLTASGFKQDEVIPELRAFGNAVALNGGGQEALQRVLLQVGQIKATDRATFEDVKPILQAGVPVLDVLADAIQKKGQSHAAAKAEARKGLSTGRFTADEFFSITDKAFTSGKYANALENQSALVIGQLSNLQDKVDAIFTEIGQGASSSVSRAISGLAQPLLSQLEGLAVGFGRLPQSIKDITTGLTAFAIVAPGSLFALGGIAQAASLAFQGLNKFKALVGISSEVGLLATSFTLLGSAVLLAAGAFSGWKLGEWARNNIPLVKTLGDAFADGLYELTDHLTGATDERIAGLNLREAQITQLQSTLSARGVVVPERGSQDAQDYARSLLKAAAGTGTKPKPTASGKPGNHFGGGDDSGAKEIRRHQLDALRSSQETLNRSAYDPGVGKDLGAELRKATEIVGKDGDLEKVKLLDGTRRNLLAAFTNYTIDLNRKASEEQLKSEAESFDSRKKFEEAIFLKRLEYDRQTLEIETATADRVYSHQNELLGFSRDQSLGSLAGEQPQTVAGRLALEQRKLAVEKEYLLQSSINDAAKVTRDRDRDLGSVAGDRYLNKITDQEYFQRVKAIQEQAAASGTEISDKYTHDIITAQQQAANASVEIVRNAQRSEFDSLRSSVEGVLQATETRGVSVFQAIGNAAKSALLGAFNQIVSSQIAAALFRVLNPGETVGFGSRGQGGGGLRGILGGLGLGRQPVFGGDASNRSKLEQTNHIGDMSLQQGAVPVVIVGQRATQGGGPLSFPGFSSVSRLAASIAPALAIAGSFGAGGGGSAVSEAIKYEGQTGFSSVGGAGSSFTGSGGESLGIPGGLNLPGLGGSSGSGGNGGILGGILGGKGGLKGLAGSFNQFLGGAFHPGNTVGLAGNLSQLAKSPAGLLAGGALAFDGLRRGGFTGLAETTAGGALIGFKYGGPIGAAIGAGVGAVAGTIRLFIKGAKGKIKDEVQKVYGIKISDGIADQILAIAKQSYGGDWRVAIRSQQVRELIKLYAQTIGSDAQKQFVGDTVHAASLSQSGGRLTQNAIYDNGLAYSYQSPLDVNGGIETSNLSTSARGSGQVVVNLNPQQTVDLWKSGTTQAIQGNPRMVASAAVSGYGSSSGRAANAAMAISPSAVQQ